MVCSHMMSLYSGHWGLPGGHLEQSEDFFACVERETLEETGLAVRGLKVIAVTNDKFPEQGKHYVTVFTKCERIDPQQEPQVRYEKALRIELLWEIANGCPYVQVMEPEKCESWHWKTWQEIYAMANGSDDLRRLFLPVENLVRENPQLESMIAT
ncbi:NUDIX hydrolase domain-like protein [Xylariaceae sp. FL0016]|nr:NUDIX hydrolase domain-like protein [Xylariaceae sp. FL0016]